MRQEVHEITIQNILKFLFNIYKMMFQNLSSKLHENIDDDEIILNLVASFFRNDNYKVATTHEAKLGLQWAIQNPPDVIVLRASCAALVCGRWPKWHAGSAWATCTWSSGTRTAAARSPEMTRASGRTGRAS